MRVFIGFDIGNRAKTYLSQVKGRLISEGVRGNYTTPSNYHVTLRFLGECSHEEIDRLKAAMDLACKAMKPFTMTLAGLGTFKKRNRYILWSGVGDGLEEMESCFEHLEKALKGQSFEPADRSLNAHITLARQVQWEGDPMAIGGLMPIEPWPVHLGKLTLFESTSASGELCYVPIYEVDLEG